MYSKGRVFVVSLLIPTLGAPVAVAAEGPQITHEALRCVPRAGNARLSAVVSSPKAMSGMKVYFRAAAEKGEYFLPMRVGEKGDYWAVLPVAAEGTSAVEYRIVATDFEGAESTTKTVTTPVTSACKVSLSEDERRNAANLVVGLTSPSQSAKPDGFLCDGIVSQITAAGELRQNEACRSGSSGTFLAVAGGAAAAAAGGVLISTSGGGRQAPPVSPSDRPQQ